MPAPKLHDPPTEAPDPLPTARAADVKGRKVPWLWTDRIGLGTVAVVEGRKGTGKTSLAAAVAADVTGGPRLSKGRKRPLGAVHWYAAEESVAAMTRPKLVAAGCDLERIRFLGIDQGGALVRRLQLPRDFWALQNTLAGGESKLLVLDPLSSCIEEGVSLHDEQQARSVLDALGQLADALGLTVLLLRHLRKQSMGPAIDQGLGGVAVGNVARTVVRCDKHPEKDGFVASWVAQSLGPVPTALEYQLLDVLGAPRVRWTGESDLDAEALSEGFGDAGDRDARGDARRLLSRRIGSAWVPAKDLLSEAKSANVSERTLRAAKAELRVRSRRIKTGEVAHWEWGPPVGGWPKGL